MAVLYDENGKLQRAYKVGQNFRDCSNELILQDKILNERTPRSLTSFSIQNLLFGRKARGVLKRRKLTRERKLSALL